VLEVGSGYGEAAMLWVEDQLAASGVAPRILGLNITPEHVELARRRLGDRPRCQPHVSFAVGDAVSARLGAARFDKVIALECAFHFRTRERFFANAYEMLKPGGTLALTDFVMFPATAGRIAACRRLFSARVVDALLRPTADLLEMPMENLCTAEEYRQQLERAGFGAVRIERLYERSTLPFVAHCRRRLRAIASQNLPDTRAFCWLMRLYLWLLPTSDYLLVVARKGS
jgi:erythromycin 3''-O-methyltransferase/microcystin synthetase protein McyJ